MKRLWAAVAVVAIAAVPSASAEGGSLTRHQYGTPGEPGARVYWKFTPSGLGSKRVPLVVYLNGCNLNAEDAVVQTRLDALAQRKKFIVAFPDQNLTSPSSYPLADGNGLRCWNWFHPDHQSRGIGEPASIAGITREVMRAHRIDPKRVFLMGASAGGSMAVNVTASYPELFAAMAVHAGCSYRTCSDATGALTYDAMGERARFVPMLISQGTTDPASPVPLGAGLASSWLGLADLADDDAMNGSVPRVPASVEHRALDQTPSPGSGDACIRYPSWSCPGGILGFQDSYPHTIARFGDANGCDIVDVWTIHGIAHAYPGGDPRVGYSDPLGPDFTMAAWRFFREHARGACAPLPRGEI